MAKKNSLSTSADAKQNAAEQATTSNKKRKSDPRGTRARQSSTSTSCTEINVSYIK